MAYYMRALHAERIHDRRNIRNNVGQPVILHVRWTFTLAAPTQVGRDSPVASVHQRGNQMTPQM